MKCGHGQVRIMNICDWKSPTQLVENDGKYTLYFPYGGAGTYKWNVRVEAPVNYSDTFSLYYMTFLTGDGITTDEGYSVNAYSSLHTKEDGQRCSKR